MSSNDTGDKIRKSVTIGGTQETLCRIRRKIQVKVESGKGVLRLTLLKVRSDHKGRKVKCTVDSRPGVDTVKLHENPLTINIVINSMSEVSINTSGGETWSVTQSRPLSHHLF